MFQEKYFKDQKKNKNTRVEIVKTSSYKKKYINCNIIIN